MSMHWNVTVIFMNDNSFVANINGWIGAYFSFIEDHAIGICFCIEFTQTNEFSVVFRSMSKMKKKRAAREIERARTHSQTEKKSERKGEREKTTWKLSKLKIINSLHLTPQWKFIVHHITYSLTFVLRFWSLTQWAAAIYFPFRCFFYFIFII